MPTNPPDLLIKPQARNRLAKPVRITEHKWPDDTVPVVSIWCTAYNHEKFIAKCLEGFLMQETTFRVEIIVHDDASTDGTQRIIQDYAARHPNSFKLIFQKQNQYSKGVKVAPLLMTATRGKFIATCEGDDYWISPNKLERQVAYFDTHPDGVVSGCRAYVQRDGALSPYTIEPNIPPEVAKELTPYDMLAYRWYFKTLTRMAHKETVNEFYKQTKDIKWGDWLFVMFCISKSNNDRSRFGFIDEVMCVYREHGNGVWTGATQCERAEENLKVLHRGLTFFSDRNALDILRGCLRQNHQVLANASDLTLRKRLKHAALSLSLTPWRLRSWRVFCATTLNCIFRGRAKVATESV